ncbi:hypothetical protein Tsubulata_045866, partial [Turnera subulata]
LPASHLLCPAIRPAATNSPFFFPPLFPLLPRRRHRQDQLEPPPDTPSLPSPSFNPPWPALPAPPLPREPPAAAGASVAAATGRRRHLTRTAPPRTGAGLAATVEGQSTDHDQRPICLPPSSLRSVGPIELIGSMLLPILEVWDGDGYTMLWTTVMIDGRLWFAGDPLEALAVSG